MRFATQLAIGLSIGSWIVTAEHADDRATFRARRAESAARLVVDPDVVNLDRELVTASDRHDYSYMWEWLGLPIIQMPSDVVAMQEIIWRERPDVIVETGIARGGSVILHCSVLQLIGAGRVIAVDIDIRPHNRAAIEEHPLSDRATLIEGSSIEPHVVAGIRDQIGAEDRVMVVLDSNHTHDHVLAELQLYSPLVTTGQFLVVADTVVEDLPPQEHRPRPWGPGNNPRTAVAQFLAENPGQFDVDAFTNDKLLMTSSRGGYLRRS